jgi:NADPH:quinone reductase
VHCRRNSRRASVFATGPSLFAYTATRADLELSSSSLFDVASRGVVKINVIQKFTLADAADAHRALEGRGTTGATVLIP